MSLPVQTERKVTVNADTSALRAASAELGATVQALDEVREVLRRRAERCLANLRDEIAVEGHAPAAHADEFKVRVSYRPDGQCEALFAAARTLRLDLSRWLTHEALDSTPGRSA